MPDACLPDPCLPRSFGAGARAKSGRRRPQGQDFRCAHGDNELDGKHFYFQACDRVLDLEDYHRSLENLARQQVFNPEKRRPWTDQDATERWEQVQKQAVSDQANCQLVASLPALEKQLDELEKNPPAPVKKN